MIAYAEQSSTARLVVWLDGARIFDRSGLDFILGSAHAMWGVGNYGGDGLGEHLWWDDTAISEVTSLDHAKTSATVSEPGTYVLRLTADGGASVSDDVTVRVAGGEPSPDPDPEAPPTPDPIPDPDPAPPDPDPVPDPEPPPPMDQRLSCIPAEPVRWICEPIPITPP